MMLVVVLNNSERHVLAGVLLADGLASWHISVVVLAADAVDAHHVDGFTWNV